MYNNVFVLVLKHCLDRTCSNVMTIDDRKSVIFGEEKQQQQKNISDVM